MLCNGVRAIYCPYPLEITFCDDLANTVEEGLNNGRDAIEPMVKQLEKEFDELRKSVEERLKQS